MNHSDGWTQGSWWTGGNSWGHDDWWSAGRRTDSDSMDSMERRIQLLEERVASLEKELASLRQAQMGQATEASPEPKASEKPSALPQCSWHDSRPNAMEGVSVAGVHEKDMEAWLAHLRSTLYRENSKPLDQLEVKIRPNWERLEVTGCRTQANRFFLVKCKFCDQCCHGQYGAYDGDEVAAEARSDLAKFFKSEGLAGKPQV